MSARHDLIGPMIHLGTLAPFRALSQRQLTALAVEAEEMVFGRQSWLERPGEPVRAMHMIVDGYVELVGEGAPATVGPGGLVGFPEILVPGLPHRGAQAVTELVALRLETDALRDLCESNFAILSALLVHLAERACTEPDALRGVIAGAASPESARAGPLDRVGRLLALHRAPALPNESMDALAELADRLEQCWIEAGQELWDPVRRADQFWLVCAGSIAIADGDGASFAVGAGGLPGFVQTLAGRAYEQRAWAAEGSTLLSISVDAFMDVLEDHFELAFATLGSIARHLVPPPR